MHWSGVMHWSEWPLLLRGAFVALVVIGAVTAWAYYDTFIRGRS